jgi:FMN phosphatase YigB (HAD superfamily)
MTQRSHDECVFIDDSQLNLQGARLCGMHAIHFKNATQLRQELQRLGVGVEAQSGSRI